MGTMTATRDKWILFNGEMVNALLEKRKTETRRLVKPQPKPPTSWGERELLQRELVASARLKVGDRVRVRESLTRSGSAWVYRADGRGLQYPRERAKDWAEGVFRMTGRTGCPSIHMPGFLSRITLRILHVRAEQLSEITTLGCLREGIVDCIPSTLRETYFALWDRINDQHPSITDPWIRVYEFEVLPC